MEKERGSERMITENVRAWDAKGLQCRQSDVNIRLTGR